MGDGQRHSQLGATVGRMTRLIVGPECLSYKNNRQAMSELFWRSKNSDSSLAITHIQTYFYLELCVFRWIHNKRIKDTYSPVVPFWVYRLAKNKSIPKTDKTYRYLLNPRRTFLLTRQVDKFQDLADLLSTTPNSLNLKVKLYTYSWRDNRFASSKIKRVSTFQSLGKRISFSSWGFMKFYSQRLASNLLIENVPLT